MCPIFVLLHRIVYPSEGETWISLDFRQEGIRAIQTMEPHHHGRLWMKNPKHAKSCLAKDSFF
jgi:hypothetical protein